jgi:predicted ATPase
MKIALENVGKIKAADIEIKGITVIAGENDSGKSTVGKALYAVFNSLYGKRIPLERFSSINSSFFRLAVQYEPEAIENIAVLMMEKKDEFLKDKNLLTQHLMEKLKHSGVTGNPEQEQLEHTAERIIRILNLTDKEIFLGILRNYLQAEFHMKVVNNRCGEKCGHVTLRIKSNDVKVKISGDEEIDVSNEIFLNTAAIYIDDPFVLDNMGPQNRNSFNHRKRILDYLREEDVSVVDQLLVSESLNKIFEIMNTICPGKLVLKHGGRLAAYEDKDGTSYNMVNVSTGMKAFIIIKTLLMNGSLEENGTLILDEPEIHLHPQWQLDFAEIIVLLQKEYGLHVLINTHSPYFLNAIEEFSRKYGISDSCKYYLTESTGLDVVIHDVTDNLEQIYAKLAKPLQDLMKMRYGDD